eukprot:7197340-Alexandrium_andersonii.AAC.1
MSASLVGSEMCIRDRLRRADSYFNQGPKSVNSADPVLRKCAKCRAYLPVSYTHLTLPTICSV